MSAVQMRESLLLYYPRRYDIPIEYHVATKIRLLLSAEKARPSGVGSADRVASVAQHRGMT